MATWDDVRRIALGLPETTEICPAGHRRWLVRDKMFVWERPLHKSDLAALGARAPQGPILGVRVEHLGIKDALLATQPDVLFTTPHFDGFPAVLVQLDLASPADLEELIVDAWLARAPKRLAKAFLAER
jgi:hypothetical protein